MTETHAVPTTDLDLIAHVAMATGTAPPLRRDSLTGRIIADILPAAAEAFHADLQLQRFLAAKKVIWREVERLRRGGGR